MARRFREIERGWLSQTMDPFDISFDTVGNVVTLWNTLLPATFLMGENDEPFEDESNPDFYLERLVVDYQVLGLPTALNLTQVLQTWVGLAILGDTEVAERNSIPLALTSNAFWTEQWRGADAVQRVLAVQRLKVGRYAPVPEGTPALTHDQLPDNHVLKFDVQQRVFLRKGESLVFVASQTGNNDDFHAWIEGDQCSYSAVLQALVRKKRGR